jgi:hypothetical protein
MSKRLPVPPELESLIEKREREKDRRAEKRRTADAKSDSVGTKSAAGAPPKGQGGADRRESKDRRQKPRRKR